MDAQEITITTVFPMRKRRPTVLGLGTRRNKGHAEDKFIDPAKTPVSKSSSRKKDPKSPFGSTGKQLSETPTRLNSASASALGRLRKTPQRLAAWGNHSPSDSGPEIIWDNDSHGPAFALDPGKSNKLISKKSQDQLASFFKKLSKESSNTTSNENPDLFEAWMKKDDVLSESKNGRLIGKGCHKKRSILNRTRLIESNTSQRVTRNRSRLLASDAIKFQEELSNFIKSINENVLQDTAAETDTKPDKALPNCGVGEESTKGSLELSSHLISKTKKTEWTTKSHQINFSGPLTDSNALIEVSKVLNSDGLCAETRSCQEDHAVSDDQNKLAKFKFTPLSKQVSVKPEDSNEDGNIRCDFSIERRRRLKNDSNSILAKGMKQGSASVSRVMQKTLFPSSMPKSNQKQHLTPPKKDVDRDQECQDFVNMDDSIELLDDLPLDLDLNLEDTGSKCRSNQAVEDKIFNRMEQKTLRKKTTQAMESNHDEKEGALIMEGDILTDDAFKAMHGDTEMENDLLGGDLLNDSGWENFDEALAELDCDKKEGSETKGVPFGSLKNEYRTYKSCADAKSDARKSCSLVYVDNNLDDMDWELDDGIVLGTDEIGIELKCNPPSAGRLKAGEGNTGIARGRQFSSKCVSVSKKNLKEEYIRKTPLETCESPLQQECDKPSVKNKDGVDVEIEDEDDLFEDCWVDNLDEVVSLVDSSKPEARSNHRTKDIQGVVRNRKTPVTRGLGVKGVNNDIDVDFDDWGDECFGDDVLLDSCTDQKSRDFQPNSNGRTLKADANRGPAQKNNGYAANATIELNAPRDAKKRGRFVFKRPDNTGAMRNLKSDASVASRGGSAFKDLENQQQVKTDAACQGTFTTKSMFMRTTLPDVSLIEGRSEDAGKLFQSADDDDFWNDNITSKTFITSTQKVADKDTENMENRGSVAVYRKYSAEDIARKKAEAKRKLDLKTQRRRENRL